MDCTPGGYGFPPENDNYNNSGSFGGYSPNGTPLKQPKFVPHEVWAREKFYIKRLSMLAGGAILLYILLSSVYVGIFQGISTAVNTIGGDTAENFNRVTESAQFMYLFEVLYSIFIVGGPFFVLGVFFQKKGLVGRIPMSKPLNAKYLPIVLLGGFGACLVGNIVTSYFDIFFEMLTGIELTMTEMPETPKSVGGVLLFFLSTAVVPALVEEMALRGIIMQPLRRYGDWFAILCSALIFGLLHCNLVQIPFAIIAGVVIGYAVVVTESVWTGVLIHFMNNAFSVTVSIVTDFYGIDSWQYRVCDVLFYVLMIVGVVCAYFVYKKYSDKKMKKSPLINQGKGFVCQPHPYSAKISNKTLFGAYMATVPMIAAIIMVCYETVLVLMYT